MAWTSMSGDVNETPADKINRLLEGWEEQAALHKSRGRRCPHCHCAAKHVACVRCNRDMCEQCISQHAMGPVCGLCYDQLTEPSDED